MTLQECLAILNLGDSATVDDIKRAYRRLAYRMHPDRNRNNESARRSFVQITHAYQQLIRAARSVEIGKRIGVCCRCQQFGEMADRPDGFPLCPSCALRCRRHRLLPMPPLVLARCAGTIGLYALAVYLLVLSVINGTLIHATAALLAGVAGMIALVHTCLTVVYCVNSREQALVRLSRQSGTGLREIPLRNPH